jgi:TAT (twin-arginine translocation) pathway signal sequence
MLNQNRRQFLKSTVGAGAVAGVSVATTRFLSNAPCCNQGDTAATNPAVVPGLVRWHGDFPAACIASYKSGKPVMLLHMLGKLDQQFC